MTVSTCNNFRHAGRISCNIITDSDCILKTVRFAHAIIGFVGSITPLSIGAALWTPLGFGAVTIAAWGGNTVRATQAVCSTAPTVPAPHWSEGVAKISLCMIRWLGVYTFIASCLELASLVSLRSLVASLGNVPVIGNTLSVFPLLCVCGLVNGAANVASTINEVREIKHAIKVCQDNEVSTKVYQEVSTLQQHRYTIVTPEDLASAKSQLKVERARLWLVTCAEVTKIANYMLVIATASLGIVWSAAVTPYLLAFGVLVAGLALVQVIFDKVRPKHELHHILQIKNTLSLPPVGSPETVNNVFQPSLENVLTAETESQNNTFLEKPQEKESNEAPPESNIPLQVENSLPPQVENSVPLQVENSVPSQVENSVPLQLEENSEALPVKEDSEIVKEDSEPVKTKENSVPLQLEENNEALSVKENSEPVSEPVKVKENRKTVVKTSEPTKKMPPKHKISGPAYLGSGLRPIHPVHDNSSKPKK